MYFHLMQLEKEGHLIIDWEPRTYADGREYLVLKQIALSTSGQKLLAELRSKSKWGKFRERFTTVIWAMATAVATTLIVMAIKG
jgi:DNA-binding PadR family transcriptional regulator